MKTTAIGSASTSHWTCTHTVFFCVCVYVKYISYQTYHHCHPAVCKSKNWSSGSGFTARGTEKCKSREQEGSFSSLPLSAQQWMCFDQILIVPLWRREHVLQNMIFLFFLKSAWKSFCGLTSWSFLDKRITPGWHFNRHLWFIQLNVKSKRGKVCQAEQIF